MAVLEKAAQPVVIHSMSGTREITATVELRGVGEVICFVNGNVQVANGDSMVVGNENYEVVDVVASSRKNIAFKECILRKIPV